MAQNPYIAGNPVGNTGSFVGRADVMREVLRVLRNPNQNTLVLFGQRRIGKTSILQYLESNLSNDGSYHPVYFDLQDKASYSLSRVLKELAGSISNALGIELPDLGRNAERAFRQTWLPKVLNSLEENHSLIMLFDEFDVLSEPKQDQAVAAFFPYLRSLLSLAPDHLQFIFVIGRNIDDVGSIALSLFKGTPSYSVSLLSHDDATALIELAEKNKLLSWNKKAAAKILGLTNGHPFLTQQICSQIFEDAYEKEPSNIPQISLADVENAIPKVLNMSGSSLEWLWDGLPPAGRVVASALAKAGLEPITQDRLMSILKESGVRVVIPELMDAPMLLQKWDLIQPADGGYVFRVELLRQWIAKHKPLKNQIKELDQLLPIAQGLYQAAVGFYQEGQFDNAVDYLRKATTKNPNHLRANELLAEILISQNNLEEAQSILERLLEYHPAVARPQLMEVLLGRASLTQDDNEKLIFYEKVLELEDDQREALSGKQRIWKRRADEAFDMDDYSKAVDAYKRAGLTDEAQNVEVVIREKELKKGLQQLSVLENENKYLEAMDLVKILSGQFPKEHKWNTDLKRLERNNHVAELYQRALGAIQSKDMKTARDLLLKVVEQNPEYEEASRYLHLAITGVDVDERSRRLRIFSLAVIGLIVLLVFVGGLTFREYTSANSMESTAQAMGMDAKNLETFLTAESRRVTAIGQAIQITETSQANMASTSQAKATATAYASRIISEESLNNVVQLRDWRFSNNVIDIAVSPNDQYIAAGLNDGKIYVWRIGALDLNSAEVLSENETSVESLAFSNDGQYLVSGSSDGNIRVWRFSPPTSISVSTATILPTSTLTITSLPASLPTSTVTPVHSWIFYKTLKKGHEGSVNELEFSPTNSSLMISGSHDGTVRIWNTDDWTSPSTEVPLPSLPGEAKDIIISAMTFSSENKLVVSRNWTFDKSCYDSYAGSSYTCPGDHQSDFYLLDNPNSESPAEWKLLTSQDHEMYYVNSAVFQPNKPSLYFASDNGSIWLLHIETYKISAPVSPGGNFISIALAGNGEYFISANYNGRVEVWRNDDGKQLTDFNVNGCSYDNNSKVVITTDQTYVVFSCNSIVQLWGIPYIP